MTLNGLEKALKDKFGRTDHYQSKNQINIVRYADDFVVTGRTEEHLNEAKEVITEFLKERGLTLSPEKTRIAHIDNGFEFLGWNFRKYKGVLLVKPAEKNVKRHIQEIRETIKEMRGKPQKDLLERLNPIIKGWANYHSSQVSKKTYSKVDMHTWQGRWKWVKQRHPNQSRWWIKDKYFPSSATRKWNFGVKTSDGKWCYLLRHTDTKIRRYVKVKAEANPFDPNWEVYYEERDTKLMNQVWFGKHKALWNRQEGVCPICEQRITIDDEWAIHHLVPRINGGRDTLDNLQMLHGNCHRQIHAKMKVILDEQPVASRKEETYRGESRMR